VNLKTLDFSSLSEFLLGTAVRADIGAGSCGAVSRMLEPDEAVFEGCSPYCNGPIDLMVRHLARFEPLSKFASINWPVQSRYLAISLRKGSRDALHRVQDRKHDG